MKQIEAASIITSSSDHTYILPSREDLYNEGDFYKAEGRPQECFNFCRYQVNIGLNPSSYQYMKDNNLTEVEYLKEFGKDYQTLALISNCSTPYLRSMPECRGYAYPSGRSPYVDPNNDYARGTDAFRDERCPKVAWGLSAIFVWDLLYEDNKDDFRLLCSDEHLMNSYYEMHLGEFLEAHNTRRYNHLTREQKEQMFIDEHLEHEKACWEKSKQLQLYPTIHSYSEAFVEDYFKFLQSKRPELTEAQKMNDEKYIRLLMHNTNVFLMEQYFESGPQRIDSRVVLMRDVWNSIINSPDFIIYNKELSHSVMTFFKPWNEIIMEGEAYYFTSDTPGYYIFGNGEAEFDAFRSKEERLFFEKLMSVWNQLYKNFRNMIDAVKSRYVIDFEDIDEYLCNKVNPFMQKHDNENPFDRIDLNQSRDEIYDDLHELIGERGSAPYYVTGPEFYNTIRKFIKHIPFSYEEYMEKRRNKEQSTTRRIWYRELFAMLEDKDVPAFIKAVSSKFNFEEEETIEPLSKDLFLEEFTVPHVQVRQQKAGIYVSYPWTDMELMDDVCRCLKSRNLAFYRDTSDCGYRSNIQSFEEQIGDGKYVVAVINQHALDSIDCMYEMCTLVMNGHPEERLFPIVDLEGVKRDSETCDQYVQSWRKKKTDLALRMANMSGDMQNEIDEMSYLNRIITEFPKFWNYIKKHNTLSVEQLKANDWSLLLDELERYVF